MIDKKWLKVGTILKWQDRYSDGYSLDRIVKIDKRTVQLKTIRVSGSGGYKVGELFDWSINCFPDEYTVHVIIENFEL